MKYSKPFISIKDQIALLKRRGLQINNEAVAESYLSNISYYRLRAYTYPFQNNTDPDHPFNQQVTFEQIIDLYVFDRKLRLLLFDAIEKIEIAFRTQLIYTWAKNHGSHWQIDPLLYRDPTNFARHISKLQAEIDRSHETFIDHYCSKYTSPPHPPAWMTLEVSSLGLLSMMYQNLKKGSEKKEITSYFGLSDIGILENWMHCFSNVRNICAHHGRVWNRRFTSHIRLPRNTKNPFIKDVNIYPYKLYPVICSVQYILNIINPNSTFKTKLKELMVRCPLKQEKEMGFPKNWESESFWK